MAAPLARLADAPRLAPANWGWSSAGCRFFLLLLLNCYLPVFLIWSGCIPFAYRFHVLALVMLGFLVHSLRRGYGLDDLGFTRQPGWDSIRWNLLFCLLGSIALYFTYRAGLLMPRTSSFTLSSFLFYMVILAPVQELIFRGILFAEMRRCQGLDSRMMVLISTFTFSYLHIIYNHPALLLITLVSGLVWGLLYLRWPSLWGISLSHSLLGALAMFLGVL